MAWTGGGAATATDRETDGSFEAAPDPATDRETDGIFTPPGRPAALALTSDTDEASRSIRDWRSATSSPALSYAPAAASYAVLA